MDHHVVIGTAGHIDHGKTTLVKALTGVDTDRLAEEKARGITIDLGFASLPLEGVHASVVDVPGHEGFIRNMVAGATGIDVALLVVAADEGVMPQTSEHVAILKHLGVRRGVIALTKTDLAPDADWRALVAEDVGGLVAAEIGNDWPVIEVSATSGAGLEALRAALTRAAHQSVQRANDDRFRMPVDRVFALAGAGTIVTGTVWSGAVAEGETVRVLPSNVEGRVRSIQVHGSAASRAEPGRRAALALVGVAREQAVRGSVVVSGGDWRASQWIDVVVTLAEGIALRPRTRLHLHHGTAVVVARVARLGEAEQGRLALRLRLDEPIVARAGDRFVLRSWSPVTTIGGGAIVHPWAERRRGTRRQDDVPRLPLEGAARLASFIRRVGSSGMTRGELEIASGYSVSDLTAALGSLGELQIARADDWFVATAEIDDAAGRMQAALTAFHAAQPLEPGMSAEAWRAAARSERRELLELAESRLVSGGLAIRDGALARRPDWNPGGTAEGREVQERVFSVLAAAGGEPPSVAELAKTMEKLDVAAALRLLARSGRIIPVADRYYEKEALDRELGRLVLTLKDLGEATPATLRERLGRSRKWLIPLLEWADREGVTVRNGDSRSLRNHGNA